MQDNINIKIEIYWHQFIDVNELSSYLKPHKTQIFSGLCEIFQIREESSDLCYVIYFIYTKSDTAVK